MTNEIPHERSYRCRKLESDLKHLDFELEQSKNWTSDKNFRWDLRLAERYIVMPLIKLSRLIISYNYRIANFNDEYEKRDYSKDLSD
jgi:hypothetical protein